MARGPAARRNVERCRDGRTTAISRAPPRLGYLSMLAAEQYDAEVTSYGLVASQNEAMRALMKARNFSGQLALVEKRSWKSIWRSGLAFTGNAHSIRAPPLSELLCRPPRCANPRRRPPPDCRTVHPRWS
jgi:hypothetical protein